ncbi:MAG: hypothetical protein ACRYFX_26740 [Janthinobacterium lividum]
MYCALFIALDPSLYLLGALLFFLVFPLLVWTPAFFAVQLFRRRAVGVSYARQLFLTGALSMVPFYLVAQLQTIQFWRVMAQVQAQHINQVADLARVWPRTYMGERMLGMTWRYHTNPEFILDGWRPPLHDPMANVVSMLSAPLFASTPFPDLSVEKQAELYHLVFTDRPTKPNCVCAHLTDAERFLYWHPEWNDPKGTVRRTGRAGLFGESAAAQAADSANFIFEVERLRKTNEATKAADSARAASHPTPPQKTTPK